MIIQQVMLNPLLLLTPTLLNADKVFNNDSQVKNAEQVAYTVIAEKLGKSVHYTGSDCVEP